MSTEPAAMCSATSLGRLPRMGGASGACASPTIWSTFHAVLAAVDALEDAGRVDRVADVVRGRNVLIRGVPQEEVVAARRVPDRLRVDPHVLGGLHELAALVLGARGYCRLELELDALTRGRRGEHAGPAVVPAGGGARG